MYVKVAESLPDVFVRKGRARRRVRTSHGHKGWQDDGGSSDSRGEEDDDADLFAWLDKATDGPLHNMMLNSKNLVKRFLPPGNVSELYDHYQVVQSMLGLNAASLLDSEMLWF